MLLSRLSSSVSSCAATEGHRLLTKVFVLGGLFELERRVPYAELRLFCAASLERAARGRAGNIMSLRRGWVRRLAHAWKSCGRMWNFSRYGRGGRGREQVLGTVAMTTDCATRSGGAATRLSMMLNGRWSAEHARSHGRHARRAQQSDRGCRCWQRKHAAAAAAFFYALRGRD